MPSIALPRRIANTGRPLGWLDVFDKIAQNGAEWFGARFNSDSKSLPDASARLRLAQAAAVRRLADSQRGCSPGFAADLYAAADRHEWRL